MSQNKRILSATDCIRAVLGRFVTEMEGTQEGEPGSLIQYCNYDSGWIAGELVFNFRIGHSSILHRIQTGANS
jgi:hypothetical protein